MYQYADLMYDGAPSARAGNSRTRASMPTSFSVTAKEAGGGTFTAMRKSKFTHTYEHIISLENLLEAWKEFVKGKRSRKDVQEFEVYLMSNILSLHDDLVAKTYRHSEYEAFNISDPKPRSINKASVRDRLLHHALYRQLYPFFDKTFISDSYSCRREKGTHKAMERFDMFARSVSVNHTSTIWVLKCDIKKFFASIDQQRLTRILEKRIIDTDIIWLLSQIINSFQSNQEGSGLPLGNLTSQLLVNIYMNEFDQFVKQGLHFKHYIRYADDFVFLSRDKSELESVLKHVGDFLWNELRLTLHPDKVSIQTLASGVDFLGWVHFPDHRVLRTTTKRRMYRNLKERDFKEESLQSYLGLISHGNSYELSQQVERLRENAKLD
jgi:RNA-directed DNA polymerase